MHVVATAGHVDHGKSTLVRALTGMEPDRFAEEQRRGLTIDLGFAWTSLGDAVLAVVDVPGHERFVPTMLAGVGPVPAALLVVAADGGWMPQTQEHLDALHALGVRHGLLVVTRCDLADPGPAIAQAHDRLRGTTLEAIPVVPVSALTGAGMPALRVALTRLTAGLPEADPAAAVRLWIDRAFTIRGAGTVVTGTLGAGTLRTGDRLELTGSQAMSMQTMSVRALQSLDRPVTLARGVSRVAVNLRGVSVESLSRGDALTTPGTHWRTDVIDVRRRPNPGAPSQDRLPAQCLLHVGSAQRTVRLRPLGPDTIRLQLRGALPLRIGDVGLLRDAGRHQVLGGVTVLDVDPPALRRRGAARARAEQLADMDGRPGATGELARRGFVQADRLRRMGVPEPAVSDLAAAVPSDGEWLIDPCRAVTLTKALRQLLTQHAREHPLERGLPLELARHRLELPTRALLPTLVEPPLQLSEGRVVDTTQDPAALPPAVAAGVSAILDDLADSPFAAPPAHRLVELGLGPRELAAAVRVGALERVGDGIYLAPGALAHAAAALRALPQPFTVSQARQAWGTSRRVALPLVARLDEAGVTVRADDDTRTLGHADLPRTDDP